MKRMMVLGLLALGCGGAFAAALPVGTYLVEGTVRGTYNTVINAGDRVKVRVARSNAVIAEAPVVSETSDEKGSFLLEVPVASGASAKACAIGEKLDCSLVINDAVTFTAPAAVEVRTPLKMGSLSFYAVETTKFTNPADGSVIEIPSAYIAELQPYLPSGESVYDPWKDYDHDGVCNYDEFKAGTLPVDSTDYLRVRSFAAKDGKFEMRFEHVGAHVYGVSSSSSLRKPAWERRMVRKADPDAQETPQVVAEGEEGGVGETTVYIVPLGEAKGEFFKLEAE